MKDIRHLFHSQVRALRWWLLIWLAALVAWDVARWTYLTEWRESWMRQEKDFGYALLAFITLFAAALVHLHPVARPTAGWRVWPVRRWKFLTAQALFILIFLVLLPGAAEMALLLHPKLAGFMGSGMRLWLAGSLWPLPLALGLAACSTSTRRFLLDAILVAVIFLGSGLLFRAGYSLPGWWMFLGTDELPAALYWIIPCSVSMVLLFWMGSFRRGFSKNRGRVCYLLIPLLYTVTLKGTILFNQPGTDKPPASKGDPSLATRLRLRINTGPAGQTFLDGLKPEETADVELWQARLEGEGFSAPLQKAPSPRIRASFGDNYWNPWTGPSSWGEFEASNLNLSPTSASLRPPQGKVFHLQATAVISVSRSVGVARLPFREGEHWEEGGREIGIRFLGTPEEAARRGFAGFPKNVAFVTALSVRRFKEAASTWVAVDLVHLPSGIHLQGRAGETDSHDENWPPRRLHTYSAGGRGTLGYGTENTRWAAGGLAMRALEHPDEYVFIVRRREPVGTFSQDITTADFPGWTAPKELSALSLPNLEHPESVRKFLRELESIYKATSDQGVVETLIRCGPDILIPLEDFVTANPTSSLLIPVTNEARKLNKALFKAERPDHRLAFFKGYGKPGLFLGADPSTPANNAALISEGIGWMKEDPDQRLTSSWLWHIKNGKDMPELYPAILRLLKEEGRAIPWRKDIHMPGLEVPPLDSIREVSVPRGPSPATEGEFYRTSLELTGPQDAYREAVRAGRPWAARVGSVIALCGENSWSIHHWLKVWPEVSDCPSDPAETRAWLRSFADRLRFNPATRRYELP